VSYGIITSQEKYMDYIYYSESGATTNYSKATLIDVSNSPVTDIDIELLPGRTISGTVFLPDGEIAEEDIPNLIEVQYQDGENKSSRGFGSQIEKGQSSYNFEITLEPRSDYQVCAIIFDPFSPDYELLSPYVGAYYPEILELTNAGASDIDITLLKKPVLIVNPIDSSTYSSTVEIRGTINDNDATVYIKVNDVEQGPATVSDGSFSKVVNLAIGTNNIVVEASNDNYGTVYRTEPVSLTIVRNQSSDNNPPPVVPVFPVVPDDSDTPPQDGEPEVKLDESTGTAKIIFNDSHIDKALSDIGGNKDELTVVALEVPKVEGADSYSVEIPKSRLASKTYEYEIKQKRKLGICRFQIPC